MSVIYPWMQSEFERLCGLADADRLPHGLLFSGQPGIGKHDLALALAKRLLCRSPGSSDLLGADGEVADACGQCPSCHLCDAGTHPDLLLVTLEDSRQIRVTQIRDMTEWSVQTANQAGRKLAIIDPADAMNDQSSNALLKCLEEPAPNTIIVLITAEPMSLLPTIRSRCQQVSFPLPNPNQAAEWLKGETQSNMDASILLTIADGCPLKARGLDDDYLTLRSTVARSLADVITGKVPALSFAGQLAKEDPVAVIELLWQLTADSIRYSLSGDENTIKNKDMKEYLKALSAQVGIEERQRLCDRLLAARKTVAGTSNANVAMLLEWVLMAGQDRELIA